MQQTPDDGAIAPLVTVRLWALTIFGSVSVNYDPVLDEWEVSVDPSGPRAKETVVSRSLDRAVSTISRVCLGIEAQRAA